MQGAMEPLALDDCGEMVGRAFLETNLGRAKELESSLARGPLQCQSEQCHNMDHRRSAGPGVTVGPLVRALSSDRSARCWHRRTGLGEAVQCRSAH